MSQFEEKQFDERDLPQDVDYYVIDTSGKLIDSTIPSADVYVDEFEVQHLADRETLLYIREHYGDKLGVMHEVSFSVRPKQFRTTKMLLGVLHKSKQ